MNDALAWIALLLLSIILIVVGFQGSAGKMVAVTFTPSILEIAES
jgi:hypothetical protein